MPRSSEPQPAPAVTCRGVTKRFYHYDHRTTSLRERFIRTVLRRPIHVRHARFSLEDFNLEVAAGESIALVGANGSGKSTALRLIAGIYPPSEGIVETRGRIAAIIELGVGFNPELTGAENVEIYAAVMGLSRREVASRFDEIVAFADLGDFIREPVKYYSSGMQARLAFAVVVCIEPDILLVDEVLAVGDEEFRQRCELRLARFRENGGTMIVVTHDLDSVSRLCSRAVWLDEGRIRAEGPAAGVVEAYRAG
ncbi:MAG TPA: ABC transporter ATP-binding protein [Gemmatimonadales bacterium]|nr:ABC transporter ATP-binding protein [Gemmatimonadales bacterium]